MKAKIKYPEETGIQQLIRAKKMKEKADEMEEAIMEAQMMQMVQPKMKFGRKK